MKLGVVICVIESLTYLLFALLFAALKGKATILISGFNTMPKEQRDLYDREKMSRDQKNALFLWSVGVLEAF